MRRSFYNRPPDIVAKEILGKLLVRKKGNKIFVGKIVETEAYLATGDSACHASRGKTKRNEVMFGSPGTIYVYSIYGMYHCLNIVTEKEGNPSAVLIRAVEPLYPVVNGSMSDARRETAGPGRLARWMEIDKNLNQGDIVSSKSLFVTDAINIGKITFNSLDIKENQIIKTKRVGIDYSEHAHLPLRFYIKKNSFVSKN